MSVIRLCSVVIIVLALHVTLAVVLLWLPAPLPSAEESPRLTATLIQAPSAEVVARPETPPPVPVQSPPVVQVQPKAKPEPAPKARPKPPTKPEVPAAASRDLAPAPAPTVPDPAPEPDAAASDQSSPTLATPAAEPSAAPVVPPHVDKSRHNNPAPVYPPASRRRGEEGTVLLELWVGADGSVSEVSIKRSSGFVRLDRAAREAVRRWRYIPARQGNRPIEYRYLQPITFGLRAR